MSWKPNQHASHNPPHHPPHHHEHHAPPPGFGVGPKAPPHLETHEGLAYISAQLEALTREVADLRAKITSQ
jgi:hypothetical protein